MTEKLRQRAPWILAALAVMIAAASLVVTLTSGGQNIVNAMTQSDSSSGSTGDSPDGGALSEEISALPEGDFEMEVGAGPQECMEHQSSAPSTSYSAGAEADTGAILGMLRYYTMNAGKAFCDGQAPSAADTAWAQLYVDLGADPANVQPILGDTASG